jgi:hypothetical protein
VRHMLRLIAIALLISIVALPAAGCAREAAEEPPPPAAEPVEPVQPADPGEPSPPAASEIAWLDTELVDVASGETFRISDFRGRPVLVKSFAVW